MVAAWKKLQLKRARQAARLQRTKVQAPARPARTKKQTFIQALAGTGGILIAIARNMGVHRQTVVNLIERPDWADMRALLKEEIDTRADLAEEAILTSIKSRVDPSQTLNARWYLSKVKKVIYGDETRTVIEGGETPVKVATLNIDVNELDLPLELKREILLALDKKEEQRNLLELKAQGAQHAEVTNWIEKDRG